VKKITQELIETHFGQQKHIRRLWWGGWFVDLDSGASVTISRKGIDFGKYREIENRTEIDETLFQWEVRSAFDLNADIWGGLGLKSGGKPEDRAAIFEYAAAMGINTGDQGLVYRHFGPEATTKFTWRGFKVSLPNCGYVKFDGGAIEKVCGDLLRPALAMIHELAPDTVVVRGKAELLVMAMHEARAMGITVIPESDMEMFIAVTANAAFAICGVLAYQWLDLWQAVFAGCVGGFSLWASAVWIFGKQFRNLARRKGLEMVRFETTTAVRKASIDEARKQGMI
jgi:hypothetical protein